MNISINSKHVFYFHFLSLLFSHRHEGEKINIETLCLIVLSHFPLS